MKVTRPKATTEEFLFHSWFVKFETHTLKPPHNVEQNGNKRFYIMHSAVLLVDGRKNQMLREFSRHR